MYKQDPPFCVQIEPTEGCPLRCSFCGINGIRSKKHEYKFMTIETAELIAQQLAELHWNVRVEFAMRGEPTQNLHLPEIVHTFRDKLPKAYLLLETNGSGLVADAPASLNELFHAGLNTIAVDEYQGIEWSQRLQNATYPDPHMQWTDLPVLRLFYPKQGPEANPHRRDSKWRLVFVAPIDVATTGTHSVLNNHTGCGAPPDTSKHGARCAKVFRELSFRYDGSVAICCNDWRGRYVIGNVHELGVEALWHHPRMNAARRYLYHGQRTIEPCIVCNAVSYRVGLLPDKKGKLTLPVPQPSDAELALQALQDGPLTEPVLRPWEEHDE